MDESKLKGANLTSNAFYTLWISFIGGFGIIEEIKSKLEVVLGVEDNKYPRLELNDEEQRMASKEGMSFPKYYPLTR